MLRTGEIGAAALVHRDKDSIHVHGCDGEQQLQDEVRHQLLIILEISGQEDALVDCMRKSGILHSEKREILQISGHCVLVREQRGSYLHTGDMRGRPAGPDRPQYLVYVVLTLCSLTCVFGSLRRQASQCFPPSMWRTACQTFYSVDDTSKAEALYLTVPD